MSARLSAAEWTSATSPTTETLWGVAYGANTYVAVGEHGTLLTSPDATTWQLGHSGTTQWLLSVAWSPTLRLFVVVGDAGTVLTSTDTVTWSPRESGTSQRLNAVAWGGGVFLAVGENGTALSSPDGVMWTPRNTGDTGWLRGLAYGNGRFVISGHDGTILTTTDAGASFQRQHIATHDSLTALTFADDHFVVYWTGPSSATSTDGNFWSITRSYFNPDIGLATATAVGATSLSAGDSGWTNTGTTPLKCNWRDSTRSLDRFVLVGTDGGIAAAPFSISVSYPSVAVEFSVNESSYASFPEGEIYPGDRVKLHASCVGNQPIAWHWTFNGQVIDGATTADLDLGAVSASHAGRYAATANCADGSTVVSATFGGGLAISCDTPTANLFDQTFRAPLPIAPSAVVALSDGRLYVAAQDVFFGSGDTARYGLARLQIDGSLDPSFDPGTAVEYSDRVTDLILQADGQLVVRATRTSNTGATSSSLIRLQADGSRDPNFRPDPVLRNSPSRPILLSDGRWVIATPTTDGAGNRTLTISRFHADGSADLTFSPISAPFAAATTTSEATYSKNVCATLDAAGHVYVTTNYGFVHTGSLAGSWTGHSLLCRLLPDGSPDPAFAVRSLGQTASLAATDRGLICSSVVYHSGLSGYYQNAIFRLHFDGTDDPSFAAIAGGVPLFVYYSHPANHLSLAVLDDGSVITPEESIHVGLVHFTSEGLRDADFSADHALAGTARDLLALADGRILIVTNNGLRRLTPDRHAARTRLTNLSVRAAQGTGEAGLITGFVTSGGDKQILARAIGPRLADFDVSAWLPDPQLKLVHAGTTLIANNDWAESGSVYLAKTFARVGAFSLVAGSHDAAALGLVPTGPSTIEISDPTGATGIVLGELYDCDDDPTDASAPRLANLSARALAGTGDDSLIVGFTVAGTQVRRFLLRAVGAPLSAYGVAHPLADPQLTLCRADGSTVCTSASSAVFSPDAAKFRDCAATVGAFALTSTVGSAQIAISLPAGNYSAVVSSGSGSTGIVLLEIYELP